MKEKEKKLRKILSFSRLGATMKNKTKKLEGFRRKFFFPLEPINFLPKIR